MSGWVGFNTAVSGLLGSQKSLYTVSHNITNAETPGYSRQKASQRAANAFNLPGIGLLGTGAEVYSIDRIRDSYTDYKYWTESAPKGEWEVKNKNLEQVEVLFNEPSDSSFRQYLDDFFTSLENLSTNPSDMSYRADVREKAVAFTKHINDTAKRLANLKEELNGTIKTKVDTINDLSHQIGALNKQIYSLEIGGTKANDLRDKRELLIDELSKIANVQVNEIKGSENKLNNGKVTISLNGIALVDHMNVTEMSYKKNGDNVDVEWENGTPLNIKSGELKGLMDMTKGDGQDGHYRGIPYYQERLDNFAGTFATIFNNQHMKGEALDGQDSTPDNIAFFTTTDGTTDINASNIKVSDDIVSNLNNIAAAAADNGEEGKEDNENIKELLSLRHKNDFFDDPDSKGTPDDYIKSVLSNLAVDGQQSERMKDTQNLIVENIEKKRESVSGVSLNEEMQNMVRFNQSYRAAAKMLTTMDQILEITVNRLGLVGR